MFFIKSQKIKEIVIDRDQNQFRNDFFFIFHFNNFDTISQLINQ